MNILKKINYVFDRKTKIESIMVLFMIILGAALELLGVSVILPLVDLGMNPDAVGDSTACKWISSILHLNETTQVLFVMVLGMIVIYFIKNLCLTYTNCTIYRFAMNVRRNLATRMMTTYMCQPYSFFLQKNSSELIRSVNSDTAQFYELLSNVFLVISNGLVAICLVIYLAIINWVMMFTVLVLLGACAGTIFLKISKKTRAFGLKNQEMAATLYRMLQQSFEGIKEIKVLNREDYFINEYSSTYYENANITRKYNLANLLPKYLIETVCVMAILGFLAINILVNGNYMDTIPQLAVFAVAAFRLLPSVNALYAYSNTIVYNRASVDLIYRDLKETEKLEKNRRAEHDAVTSKVSFQRAIELKNVTFRYENMSEDVLKNVSLTIQKGQSVALIGPSGGGKTTLADILLGVLQPTEGQVLVDDMDIQTDIGAWTNNVGYIPQVIYLLDDTIRNNVAFGISPDEIDDNRVWRAIEEAQLKEFVTKLDKGLDTAVGERGARISGGQRQRIGIARALYSNPQILVFDEATSALDNETEHEVMRAIDSLHGTKTIFMIAHRLTTIQNCDVVYEVGDGQVKMKSKD